MEPISKNCNFAIICVEKLEKSKNISIFCNKKNLGRILCFFFFFFHTLAYNEIPQSLGYLCINQQKRRNASIGACQSTPPIVWLHFSTLGICRRHIMNASFKTAKHTVDWKEKPTWSIKKVIFRKGTVQNKLPNL